MRPSKIVGVIAVCLPTRDKGFTDGKEGETDDYRPLVLPLLTSVIVVRSLVALGRAVLQGKEAGLSDR